MVLQFQHCLLGRDLYCFTVSQFYQFPFTLLSVLLELHQYHLKLFLMMNLDQIIDLVKSTVMVVEVILNQDRILDYPSRPHILSIYHSRYHSWISAYTCIFKMVMS